MGRGLGQPLAFALLFGPILDLVVGRDIVRRPGAAVAHRLGRAGRAVLRGLVLDLAVELGTENEGIGGKVHPGQQRHDRSQ